MRALARFGGFASLSKLRALLNKVQKQLTAIPLEG